jgi:hypothetical protein
MNIQKTMQAILIKKNYTGSITIPDNYTGSITIPDFKVQSHNHKNSMVLAQNHTHRPMNRDLKISPSSYSHLILDKSV